MNRLLKLLEREEIQLRPSERRVAQAVMSDPVATVRRTLAEVATDAQVSEPTVVRFCRAIGFSGFREFQITFAQALAVRGEMAGAAMTPGHPADDLIGSIFSSHIAALSGVRDHLAETDVNGAIGLLIDARRIEFFGVGASGAVAVDAQHKFFRLGLPTLAYIDPHMQIMSAATLRAGDVVVAISHTGRTKDILESVLTARDSGAAVIAITSPRSPLADAASLTLPVDTKEDTDLYTPMMSRLAHLAVVDVLATGLALRAGKAVEDNLRRLKARLQFKRLPRQPSPRRNDNEPE